MEATEVEKLVELEDRHWWYRERRHLLRQMVLRNFQGRTRGRVAMDIGAAGGGNTRVLQGLGMVAVAVEYGAEGAEAAYERGVLSLQGDACRLPFPDGSADVVVAFDVLEHIEDDGAAMGEIKRVLRPKGWLFAAVPSDMKLWSEHDRAVGHHRRYERGELERLAEDAGLVVRSSRSWNVLLRPVVRVRRRKLSGSHLEEVHPAVNAVLGLVIMAERALPPLKGRPGVSLLVEAQHPAD